MDKAGTAAGLDDVPFTTKPLHPTFGMEVIGLDVSKPLDERQVSALTALSFEHKLLLFRGQSLSDAQLNAFAACFGNTNQVPPKTGEQPNDSRQHNISRLGNIEARVAEGKPPTGYGAVARFWHSDSSWRAVPTWLSFLTSVELPDEGGDTWFADMAAAYEALPDERKALLDGKNMVHSWDILRRYEPTIAPTGVDGPPPATHPVVRTINGRKSLFLSGHAAYYIGNMPFEQGEALFDELLEHATSPRFVYQHKWSLGDLLVWDNRATLHRVLPYDWNQRRVMHRAEVVGAEAPL